MTESTIILIFCALFAVSLFLLFTSKKQVYQGNGKEVPRSIYIYDNITGLLLNAMIFSFIAKFSSELQYTLSALTIVAAVFTLSRVISKPVKNVKLRMAGIIAITAAANIIYATSSM